MLYIFVGRIDFVNELCDVDVSLRVVLYALVECGLELGISFFQLVVAFAGVLKQLLEATCIGVAFGESGLVVGKRLLGGLVVGLQLRVLLVADTACQCDRPRNEGYCQNTWFHFH